MKIRSIENITVSIITIIENNIINDYERRKLNDWVIWKGDSWVMCEGEKLEKLEDIYQKELKKEIGF